MLQRLNLCSVCSLKAKINFHILSVVVLVLRLHVMSINVPFYILLQLRGHLLNIRYVAAGKY